MKHILWLTIIFLIVLPLQAQDTPYDIALRTAFDALNDLQPIRLSA